MSDAKYNKNILNELLVNSQVHGYIRQQELDELLEVIHNPFFNNTSLYDYSINLEPDKKEPEKKKQRSRKTKKKSTYYLTENTYKDLVRAEMDIRKHVPEQYRSQISKTKIVNQALSMILMDFQLKGKNSKIMQTILQNFDVR